MKKSFELVQAFVMLVMLLAAVGFIIGFLWSVPEISFDFARHLLT